MTMHKLPFFYDYVFPNVILPNGLKPEMGIINYIHTLYSNRLRSESFFEEHLDDDANLMRLTFGETLGKMPNSLRMNGSYLRMPCFKHQVEIQEESVYFGKQREVRKYIYPIKVTLHFDRFTGTDLVGSKLNGDYFWKFISEEVLNDVRQRKAVIFLDWANENFIERAQFHDLHLSLAASGIPKEQIILAINSFNAQDVYESWFTPEERRLEVRNLPFLLSNISYHYDVNSEWRNNEVIFRAGRSRVRKNHFLLPIRRSRDHRLAVLYKLATDGLLERGDWSCLDPVSVDHGIWATHSFDLGIDHDAIRRVHETIPHTLQHEPASNFGNVHGWNDRNCDPSLNSYLYIATETYVHGDYKSLTEKVFKPIVNLQPFVFVAFPGALAELRKLGFKTFSPFINESYDNEQDKNTRLRMICEEIKRLCSMSIEEMHNWYWQMEEIMIHNHRHLLGIWHNEKHAAELISYLNDRIQQ